MSAHKTITTGIIFIVVLAATSAWAVTSSLWEEDTKEAFEAGEPRDVSIVSPGRIVLGPKAQVTDIDARYGWTLVEDSKGAILAGTGNDGKIFKVSPKGETKDFADLELQQVFAMAIDGKDTLYAGGSPGGKIYSISANGKVSEYFDTGQKAIWSLYLAPDGTLFAGTGDDGQIFKVKGKHGEVVYDSSERRILSLTGDKEGNLYAGSDQNGIIYKIDPKGHPSVLYDTELEEITSMTMDADGNLYAVSAPGELFVKIPPPQAAPLVPKVSQEAAAIAAVVSAQAGAPVMPTGVMPGMPAMPTAKKRTCIIYRITKDGAASKFWSSPEKLIFSIVFDGSNLLAGSGDEGVVYMITPERESGTFYKADQKEVLALYGSSSGEILASLGNDAAVIRFARAHAPSGSFVSEVHDATAVSRWGRVFWEADLPPQTKLSLATRSGNSETPDDTWSKWSEDHSGEGGFISASPNARYIQWRAKLATSNPGETPELKKVTVAYVETNLPPEVESVTVGETAAQKKKGAAAASLAAALKAMASGSAPAAAAGQNANENSKANQEGVVAPPATHQTKIKIQWKATDPNEDKLQYTLYFRGVGETRWLRLEKELTETSYEWDTETVPDGEYHVKLVASDSPSNPPGKALTAERESDRFEIDNTRPAVKISKAVPTNEPQRYRITAVVSDNLNPVSSAEYSVDAGEWQTVFPEDGIFDSLSEKVEFTTEKLDKGEHTVALKAVDYFGNVGAGKITFVVK